MGFSVPGKFVVYVWAQAPGADDRRTTSRIEGQSPHRRTALSSDRIMGSPFLISMRLAPLRTDFKRALNQRAFRPGIDVASGYFREYFPRRYCSTACRSVFASARAKTRISAISPEK